MTILAFAGIVGSWIISAMDQKLGTKKTMIFFGIWYAVALPVSYTHLVMSFSMAATTFSGQNYGAGNMERVRKRCV